MATKCNWCNEIFERSIGHLNQNKKRDRKNYCSKKCRDKGKCGKRHPRWKGGFRIIECSYCEEKFKRAIKSINQNKKLNLKNYCSKKCADKTLSKNKSGKNHPNWKGGITSENVKERNSLENKRFIKTILKRDDFICQACSQYGDKLHVDHILPWSLYPKLRYKSENARTLCKPCHHKYGAKPHLNPQKWAISPAKSNT